MSRQTLEEAKLTPEHGAIVRCIPYEARALEVLKELAPPEGAHSI